jgi:RNA polymerase sigma-70 factor (ECF subfamily)
MTVQTEALESHWPAILAFLRRRCWSREEAEDLCQETFYRALRNGGRLRDPAKLRPYLLRIANNLFLNQVRRPPLVTGESALGEHASLEEHPDAGSPCPATALEGAELQRKLHEQLAGLPATHRVAFEQGVLQRRAYAEVAQENGWTVGQVKAYVFRARKQLMNGLREHLPVPVAAEGRAT